MISVWCSIRLIPAFSTPAFSALAILTVSHFPLPHFQSPLLGHCRRMPRKLNEQLVSSRCCQIFGVCQGRLHIPAGQRTCTPCTGHHRAATTWNPRLYSTRCLASEFTRPQSSWLYDLGADTRTRLSDSDSGHRWSEAAPYLCLGWAEAKRRW